MRQALPFIQTPRLSVHLKIVTHSATHPQESMKPSLWQIQTVITHTHSVPESSESLLSSVSSMSSSDISISSSRLMPISCSLCKFLISCKTHSNEGIRSTKSGECMIYQALVGERFHDQCWTLALRESLEIKVEKKERWERKMRRMLSRLVVSIFAEWPHCPWYLIKF